jgi:hypothetical protein
MTAYASRNEQERLAEGPDMNHDACAIETLQRRHGPSFVAILAIVVVLEHDRASRTCPREERETTLDGHRDSERRLMTGRHVDEPGRGRATNAGSHVDAVLIDGHRDDPRLERVEDGARARVAGVFHPHLVSAFDREPRDEIDDLLHARNDHDLVAAAHDAARHAEVLREHFTQRSVAARVGV